MSIIFRFTILINILLKKLCLLRYGINDILSGTFIFKSTVLLIMNNYIHIHN